MINVAVIGCGEIGNTLCLLEADAGNVVTVYDLDDDLCAGPIRTKYEVVHVCIPFHDYEQFSKGLYKWLLDIGSEDSGYEGKHYGQAGG